MELMVVSLKHIRGLMFPGLGSVDGKEQLQPSELEPIRTFGPGDVVILNKENPYKGTLVGRKPYVVLNAFYDRIKLRAENGTEGWFLDRPFSLVGEYPVGKIDPADEYYAALDAQRAMDEV